MKDSKLTQEQMNNLRTMDLRLMKRLMCEHRLTLTEKWRISRLESDVSSNIHKHYVLTDAERAEMRMFEDSPREIPREKDAIERVLESIYDACKYQELGWHEYKKLSHDTMAGWVSQIAIELGHVAAVKEKPYFYRAVLHLAATVVAATVWGKGEDKFG